MGHAEGGVQEVGEDQPGPPLLRHRPVCAAVSGQIICAVGSQRSNPASESLVRIGPWISLEEIIGTELHAPDSELRRVVLAVELIRRPLQHRAGVHP